MDKKLWNAIHDLLDAAEYARSLAAHDRIACINVREVIE